MRRWLRGLLFGRTGGPRSALVPGSQPHRPPERGTIARPPSTMAPSSAGSAGPTTGMAWEARPGSARRNLAAREGVRDTILARESARPGVALDGAALAGATLNGAALGGSTLDAATVDGTALKGAALDGATVSGAALLSSASAATDGRRVVVLFANAQSLAAAFIVGEALGKPLALRDRDTVAGGAALW